MLSFAPIPRSDRLAGHTTALATDYVQFEQQRRQRRQYIKAFTGMTILVLAGAAFGFVPLRQAEVAAALLAAPPVTLGIIDAIGWTQLVRRLTAIRAEMRSTGTRGLKVVKKS
jgi:hypothetical protein